MTIKKYTKKELQDFSKYLIENCIVDTPAFNNIFDFIPDKKLQKFLVKSYREAIFVSNLVDSLDIKYDLAHPLNEIQILHYASICEILVNNIASSYQLIGRSKSFLQKCEAFKIIGIIDGDLKEDLDKLWMSRNCIHISKAMTVNMKFFKKLIKGNDGVIVRLCSSLKNFVNNNIN
jgi:hypothetical protein